MALLLEKIIRTAARNPAMKSNTTFLLKNRKIFFTLLSDVRKIVFFGWSFEKSTQ